MIKRRTRHEVVCKLLEKGFAKEDVLAEADRLGELGYIDDEDYARRYINDAVNLKKYGKRRIAAGLDKKGVSPQIYMPLLEQMPDCLLNLMKEKFSGIKLDNKQKGRILRYFVNKGYEYGQIYECMRNMGDADEV